MFAHLSKSSIFTMPTTLADLLDTIINDIEFFSNKTRNGCALLHLRRDKRKVQVG